MARKHSRSSGVRHLILSETAPAYAGTTITLTEAFGRAGLSNTIALMVPLLLARPP